MARKASPVPTPVETEILNVLWSDGELNVETVTKRLPLTVHVGGVRGRRHYNTVMTILQIMKVKRYVVRRKDPAGRGFLYRSRLTRDAIGQDFLADLVHRVFDGDVTYVRGLLTGVV